MRPWIKSLLISLTTLLLVVVAEVTYLGWCNGKSMVRLPVGTRRPMVNDPGHWGLVYEPVLVTTSDGVTLHGWFIPGDNGATIMAQHGYRGDRTDLLFEAAFLNERGYSVLLTSVRGHDLNEEERFTFGEEEIRDMEAWYAYLLSREDVNPERIGILGESFGGALAINYAAQNEKLRAVAAMSTYARAQDALGGVRVEIEKQGMPGWLADLFVPFIVWAAEENGDIRVDEINTTDCVADLSPRPLFIGHGGQDRKVSIESARELYQAAGQPKLIWEEPEARHNFCDHVGYHDACQAQLLTFFDTYLLES